MKTFQITEDQLTALRDMAARLQEGDKARTRVHEGAELWRIVTEIFNGGVANAAAPELYEALDEAINYVAVMSATLGDHAHAAFLDKATAALAKARGET